jgi:uncharacterized membrane protein (DUF2068 family)
MARPASPAGRATRVPLALSQCDDATRPTSFAGWVNREHFFHRIVTRLHGLHAHTLRIAGIVAIGYCVLELVEGIGLWLDQLWAEYLTVIATSLFIPFEVYELAIRPSL